MTSRRWTTPAPSSEPRTIRVGAMFPRGITSLDTTISYSRTAGGLTVGMNKILSEKILTNTNFTFTFFFDQCNEAQSAGGAISLIKDSNVDVIIGPACSSSVSMAATIGAFYNFPVFAWSTVLSAELSNTQQYPTLASTSISTYTLVQALGEVFKVFEWNEFAFFYAVVIDNASPRCAYIQADMDSYVSTNDNMTMVYKRDTSGDSISQLRTSLRRMKSQARIIVTCYEFPNDKRNFMAAALDEGMTTNDYVFIFIQTVQLGFGAVPFWVSTTATPDGRDNEIKKACEKVLIVDLQQLPDGIDSFYEQAKSAMFQWPINCVKDDCPPSNITKQAVYLADTFYMYALAVNRTIRQYPNDSNAFRNGTLIHSNVIGSFNGYSGTVKMNNNGTREPTINIIGLDGSGNQKVFFIIERKDNSTSNIIPQFQDEKVVWANRGGIRPLSHPVCDFDGSACPPSFLEANLAYVIGAIALIIAFLTILCLVIYYSIRVRQENRRKMDELWQIPFVRLVKPDEKDRDLTKSSRSMLSSISSTSTKLTHTSKKDTEHFDFYLFDKETIVGKKHASRPKFSEHDHVVFRAMQQLNHDNLCRFIGLSMDGPMYLSLWRYCSRGCLRVCVRDTIFC
uniref:Receptor ligand binding region domain-containing protein n=1 Tax=Panagrolaimus sp. PS1159 TaxID=55785 RepID=A0AC35GPH5_9BILA